MFFKIIPILFFVIGFSAKAALMDGRYESADPGQGIDPVITVSSKGQKLSGWLYYKPNYKVSFAAFIADPDADRLSAEGSLIANYEYGYSCSYPLKAVLYPSGTEVLKTKFKLWLYMPRIWTKWFLGINCNTVGNWEEAPLEFERVKIIEK